MPAVTFFTLVPLHSEWNNLALNLKRFDPNGPFKGIIPKFIKPTCNIFNCYSPEGVRSVAPHQNKKALKVHFIIKNIFDRK